VSGSSSTSFWRIAWISSSGKASSASGLGYPRHEPGQLEDLFCSLRGSELSVVTLEGRPLGLPLGAPVPDPLTLLHGMIVPRRAGAEGVWQLLVAKYHH